MYEKGVIMDNENKLLEFGTVLLNENKDSNTIYLLDIIGEIEGHENSSPNLKTTKYEHILPILAKIQDSTKIDGLFVILQTTGGDCSAGLAIAEMIASINKPSVSLVIGDSHSIGVPLATATDYSFIVESATMILHPVRMNGTIIGAPQTFDYFKIIQDRIVEFISTHSDIKKERVEKLMLSKTLLTKDLGTILVGGETVKEGLINEVGGIDKALSKLHELINNKKGSIEK